MRKEIWLDMDGSFVDLYGVENWLDYLLESDPTPYAIAQPMYNMNDFKNLLLELKKVGYKIGIISWLAKNGSKEYNQLVRQTKREWLKKYGILEICDNVRITPYGIKKSTTCKKYGYGVLVDDEEKNRKDWKNGITIDATTNIMLELRKLLN